MPISAQRTHGCSPVWVGLWLIQSFYLCSLEAAEEFRLWTRPLAIPERGTVPSYVLQTAQNRFSFLAPPQWKVKENATTKEVVMMAPSLTTSIRFKLTEASAGSKTGEDLTQWRKAILKNYPGAKITAEFPCYTSNVEGTAFDLEPSSPERVRISTRLAFFPLGQGRLEFNLTAPRGKL